MFAALRPALSLLPLALLLSGFSGCSSNSLPKPTPGETIYRPGTSAPEFPVMLGIDVLEADGFRSLRGKRVALLTNQAGVNRRGESTIDVLRRAPGVQLVTLFAPEHGVDGEAEAGVAVANKIHARTGLPVISLYNPMRGPNAEELRNIDVFIIDLPDIGVRSYTFATSMKYALEGCFRNGVEAMVLDRPNPLGGLKVDGPMLDAEFKSGVGQFLVPYVHGLTMGELARMAYESPRILNIPEETRRNGRLTVVPMRGWNRSMRWPDTGLQFVWTSKRIQDFDAVIGYAMVGLGATPWYKAPTFASGIGTQFFHRGLSFPGRTVDQLLQDLNGLRVSGVSFRRRMGLNSAGQQVPGVYVDVSDWDAWRPTELSFHLMRLAARLRGNNPFATMTAEEALYFNKHVGSGEWFNAIKRDGANVDVEGFLAQWRQRAAVFQELSKRFWLYQ